MRTVETLHDLDELSGELIEAACDAAVERKAEAKRTFDSAVEKADKERRDAVGRCRSLYHAAERGELTVAEALAKMTAA